MTGRPPGCPPGRPPGAAWLRRAVRRTFAPVRPYDDRMQRFVRDVGRLHGCPAAPVPAARTTFTEMIDACAEELVGSGEDVRVAVLGHAGWDAEPNWPACRLSALLPARPLSFAVSDRGPATAWTALAVALDQARRRGGGRALVVLLDQSGGPVGAGNPATVDRLLALDLHVPASSGSAEHPEPSGRREPRGPGLGVRLDLEAPGPSAVPDPVDPGAPTTAAWWSALDRLAAGAERVVVDAAGPGTERLDRVVLRAGPRAAAATLLG